MNRLALVLIGMLACGTARAQLAPQPNPDAQAVDEMIHDCSGREFMARRQGFALQAQMTGLQKEKADIAKERDALTEKLAEMTKERDALKVSAAGEPH